MNNSINKIVALEHVVAKVRVELGVTSRIHWATSAYFDRDIVIHDLNHSFNGSLVLIKMVPMKNWKTYKNNQKGRNKEAIEETIHMCKHLVGDKADDIKMVVCGDKQPTGDIVKVLHTPDLLLKGTLLVKDDMPKNLTPEQIHKWRGSDEAYDKAFAKGSFLISPLNDNFPYVYIRQSSCSKEDMEKMRDHYVEVKINVKWNRGYHPNGVITRILNHFDDMDSEHKALLIAEGMDHTILSDDLVSNYQTPEEAMKSWPKLKEDEYVQPDGIVRYDMRGKDNMVSIDPPTARDLDDCLSVRVMPDGLLLVGVHIADVGHFIGEATELDYMARKRQTSTYMVGECIPMLPRALSNSLCSLNPGEDKFTFSCYWLVDYHASMQQRKLVTTTEPFFRKTITRSVCRFAYSQALTVMEGKENDDTWSGIQEGASKDEIRQSIAILMNLHRCVRESRPNWVDLSRKGGELKFKLDESGKICDIVPYETSEANKMIETWMVEANCAAARAQPKEMAVIRTHKGFSEKRGEHLVKCLEAVGINISVKSKGAFIASLKAVPDHLKESLIGTVTFALEKAVYTMFPNQEDIDEDERKNERELSNDMLKKMVVGKSVQDALESYAKSFYDVDMGHSGLDVDLYTHFTSPIRRYPDIMVHRNIAKTLVNEAYIYEGPELLISEESLLLTPSDVEDVLLLSNKMKDKAKAVGKYSQLLHLNHYLKTLEKPISCTGLVVNIQIKRGLINMTVALDKIPVMVDNVKISPKNDKVDPFASNIKKAYFDSNKFVGTIEWRDGTTSDLSIHSQFAVQLVYCHTTPPSSKIVILGPAK